MVEMRNVYTILSENLKRGDYLEDLDVDRIALSWTFEKSVCEAAK
jgi:hypothetical protein